MAKVQHLTKCFITCSLSKLSQTVNGKHSFTVHTINYDLCAFNLQYQWWQKLENLGEVEVKDKKIGVKGVTPPLENLNRFDPLFTAYAQFGPFSLLFFIFLSFSLFVSVFLLPWNLTGSIPRFYHICTTFMVVKVGLKSMLHFVSTRKPTQSLPCYHAIHN